LVRIPLLDLRLLRRDIRLCNADGSLLSLEILAIDVALLQRHPAFVHERLVACPSRGGKIGIGLLLAQGCLALTERGLGLGDLMVDLGCRDLGEDLPCLHMVADIDIALDGDEASRQLDGSCSR
jgi:hypothetical protein